MEQLSYEKKVQAILEKFLEYNKINKDIKRFGIFNSFSVSHQFDNGKLYFEMRNTDDEDQLLVTSASSEQSIMINFVNDKEFNWLIKTMNRFIEKSKLSMKKARELAKPQVGILVYDEFTDSYYLNPTSGPVLLKSKEIAKEIASTRIDIFGIFINLRSILIEKDRVSEIIGDSLDVVCEKSKEKINKIIDIETRLRKIEGIPRCICFYKEDNDTIYFESFVTTDFGLEIEEYNKINENNLKVNKTIASEVENMYNYIGLVEDISLQMIEIARDLISKNDPRMYVQDKTTKLWILTTEGRNTMQNLNIMDFLNNDISEINFEIN